MIYSIGYQRLRGPEVLLSVAEAANAVVWDVRSVPMSRRPGFGRRQLEALLGWRYEWRGVKLGGKGSGPTEDGLERLVEREAQPLELRETDVVLLCLEEAPADCHRHHKIAVPLLAHDIDVVHIFRDELVTASALQRSLDDLDEDAPYEFTDSPFAL